MAPSLTGKTLIKEMPRRAKGIGMGREKEIKKNRFQPDRREGGSKKNG